MRLPTSGTGEEPSKLGFFGRVDAAIGRWIKGWNPYEPGKVNRRGLQPVQVEESAIRRNAAIWFLGFFEFADVTLFCLIISGGRIYNFV